MQKWASKMNSTFWTGGRNSIVAYSDKSLNSVQKFVATCHLACRSGKEGGSEVGEGGGGEEERKRAMRRTERNDLDIASFWGLHTSFFTSWWQKICAGEDRTSTEYSYMVKNDIVNLKMDALPDLLRRAANELYSKHSSSLTKNERQLGILQLSQPLCLSLFVTPFFFFFLRISPCAVFGKPDHYSTVALSIKPRASTGV